MLSPIFCSVPVYSLIRPSTASEEPSTGTTSEAEDDTTDVPDAAAAIPLRAREHAGEEDDDVKAPATAAPQRRHQFSLSALSPLKKRVL